MGVWCYQVALIPHWSFPAVYNLCGEFSCCSPFHHFIYIGCVDGLPLGFSLELFFCPQKSGLHTTPDIRKRGWVFNARIFCVPAWSITVGIWFYIGKALLYNFKLFLFHQCHFLPLVDSYCSNIPHSSVQHCPVSTIPETLCQLLYSWSHLEALVPRWSLHRFILQLFSWSGQSVFQTYVLPCPLPQRDLNDLHL